ncbi:MAG: transporter [Alphaproteobacteria bacterium]|nr:transporter [Alphaproteobacteria bacterium]MBL6937310.1 transporter [Alphaproteobacteria bacterium]MBL7096128.1 transporter [Alphaproteobacteria bacterium]
MTGKWTVLGAAAGAFFALPALAGPPYVTDDPQPTDLGNYEIYAFSDGTATRDGIGGAAGVDFNYGAAPDLQLTAVLPLAWNSPNNGPSVTGLGNVELAAKYKILHQDTFGLDVAVFPRVFLPAGSEKIGARHVSLLLPVWVGRSWGQWSTFGGGGCTLNHGGDSQNFCEVSWALTRQITDDLQLGAEIFHQTADTKGGFASTGAGLGAIYDLNENFHLLGSVNVGLQHASDTNNHSWYVALLSTF